MKIKIVTSAVFTLLIILSLTYNNISVRAENNNEEVIEDGAAPITGTLFTFSGCGSVTLDGATYFVQDRTTSTTLCLSVTSGGGLFSCSAEAGHLIYIQFGYQGKIGCALFTQQKKGTLDLKVCMQNSNRCIEDF